MRTRLRHPYVIFCVGVIGVMVVAGAVQAHGSRPLDRDITVANLNILHGFACNLQLSGPVSLATDQCRVAERLDLLVQHILAAGCPDIITLQENVTSPFILLPPDPTNPTQVVPVGPLQDTVALLEARLPDLEVACGFAYQVIFDPAARRPLPEEMPNPGRGIDEELILTRYPMLTFKVVPLYSPLAPSFFRHVLFTRIDHPMEPIDVFTVHLAAEADFGSFPCGAQVLPPEVGPSPACPAECDARQDTVRECQAKQMVNFIKTRHNIPGTGIITGDLNAPPFSKVYNEFTARGWIDSHRQARNAECDPSTGINCTAGREDRDLSDLASMDLHQNVRLDYIFVIKPHRWLARCRATFDGPSDRDRDGTGTGLFAHEPNPFMACGSSSAICWASDHSGNQLDLNCTDGKSFHDLLDVLHLSHRWR